MSATATGGPGPRLLTAPLAVGAISDVAGMRWGVGIVAPLLAAAFVGAVVSGRWEPGRGGVAMVERPAVTAE